MTTPRDAAAHVEAVKWAAHWSQHWFLDSNSRDRFRAGDLEAGWATHVEAYLLLLELASELVGASIHQRSPSARRWLKQHGFDRLVRRAGLLSYRGSPASESEVAAVVEIPTPSMADPAGAVMAAAGGSAVVGIADPRAASRVARFGVPTRPLKAGWRMERQLVRSSRRTLLAAWRAFASCPPIMDLNGVDLGPSAVQRLAPLVQRSMPHLSAEYAAIEQFLQEIRPAAVAIASDQHRIGRLTVAAARARGVRTVVLQHGLPQARIGYVPVVADAVAAWSHESRKWFIEAGTDSRVVAVMGNPRAEELTASAVPLDGRRNVLLALSPTARATNLGLVRGVLDAINSLPDARLTIKLHPGEGDWSYVRPLIRRHAAHGRVSVRRHEPLGSLLQDASVVVLHRSSVALEALAAGRPVVAYRSGDDSTVADLELPHLNLPTFDNSASLAGAIAELSMADNAHSYFLQRHEAILASAGPTEGSARRIVEFMRSMSSKE